MIKTRTFFVCLLIAVSAAACVIGCGGQQSEQNGNTSGHAGTYTPGSSANAPNQLTIVSPHDAQIQVEFEQIFKAKHPEVKFKWIDQGGSSDDLRLVESQFAGKGKDQGTDFDIFFGGGLETFVELERNHLLQPLPSDFSVPATLNGVPLRGKNNTWVAAVLSGFGILVNQVIASRDNLPIPTVWADMANPKLNDRVELADPRHSGSAHVAYEIILQSEGWDRGWQVLTAMAANARKFLPSSSKLLDDVQGGEAVMVPAIDFYARGRIAQAGADKLTYIVPKGQSVVTPDPIGILRGAPHLELARDFVKAVMSPEGQKLWMYKKGVPGGPTQHELYRQAAVPSLYKPISPDSLIQQNPYTLQNTRKYDTEKATLRRKALDDLIGTVLIDNQKYIKDQWTKTPDPAKIAFVPVTEDELVKVAKDWSDQSLRNSTISQWSQAARQHFSSQ